MEGTNTVLNPILPVVGLLALIFFIGILFPLFDLIEGIFWIVVVAVIVIIPMLILAFFIYQAYKGNENVGKFFVIVIFTLILMPAFVHPEVLDTRVTISDIDELKSVIASNYETMNQTLNTINQKDLVCPEIKEENENILFIVFPILLMQIITTLSLIFFFRNR